MAARAFTPCGTKQKGAAESGRDIMRRTTWKRSSLVGVLALMGQILAAPVFAQPVGLPSGAMGPTEVGVITLEESAVPFTTTVPGRAVAFEEVDIRPRVGGTITEIVYTPGTPVTVGDVLFRIENSTYSAEVASAEADLFSAEASLQAAQATMTRYEGLEGAGVTTAEEVESARVSLAQAEADVRAAEAALDVANLDLQRTEIVSPIQGIAAIPSVSVGALLTANQTDALTTVTRIDPIYIDVEESSRRLADIRARIEAGSLRQGETLDIRLQLETGETYESKGQMVSPGTSVSTSTGTLAFRMQFDNPDRQVLPGQFLRVDVVLGTTPAVLVPQGATARASTGELTAFVAVDGFAEKRTLTEQGSYQNAWIVTQGVAPGETLIVDGLSSLRAGVEVSPVPVTISEEGVATAADGRSEAFERPAEMPAGTPPAMPEGGAPEGGPNSAEGN